MIQGKDKIKAATYISPTAGQLGFVSTSSDVDDTLSLYAKTFDYYINDIPYYTQGETTATVDTRVTFDNRMFYSKFSLIKEKGRWMITSLNASEAPYGKYEPPLLPQSVSVIPTKFEKRGEYVDFNRKVHDTAFVSYYYYPKEIRGLSENQLDAIACRSFDQDRFQGITTVWDEDGKSASDTYKITDIRLDNMVKNIESQELANYGKIHLRDFDLCRTESGKELIVYSLNHVTADQSGKYFGYVNDSNIEVKAHISNNEPPFHSCQNIIALTKDGILYINCYGYEVGVSFFKVNLNTGKTEMIRQCYRSSKGDGGGTDAHNFYCDRE